MSALSIPMPATVASRVYWSRSFSAVMRAMADALGKGERVTVITGECGAGKTTLLSVFREQIPSPWAAIQLDSCRTDAEGLLPWLLHAFGAPSGRRMAPDAGLDVAAALIRARGKATALLIDEAQTLKGRELAQLAALLERTPEDGLRLFLFGQPGLAVSFQRGRGTGLAALPHRRHVLRPLDRADVEGYTRFFASACGRSRVTFTDEAIDLVCAASRGSPRLIDRLCGTALEICRRAKVDAVDAGLVREAARLANDFDVFAADVVPGHAAAAPDPPAAAPPTIRNAPRTPRSGANAARLRAAEAPQDRRRERPTPSLQFLSETPPGSAVSSAELIVYEEPSCRSGAPALELPRLLPGAAGPVPTPGREARLPDPDTLIRNRLLGLSSLCVLVGAAGFFLQPSLLGQHASLVTPVAPVAPGDPADSTDAAPQAGPLAQRPEGDRRDALGDLLGTLPPWRRSSGPDEDARPRVFGPSRRKRPLELSEVLELWRPLVEPDR